MMPARAAVHSAQFENIIIYIIIITMMVIVCYYDAPQFESCIKDKSKPFFVFETTATDTHNMQFILESTIKIVERENLQNMGLE